MHDPHKRAYLDPRALEAPSTYAKPLAPVLRAWPSARAIAHVNFSMLAFRRCAQRIAVRAYSEGSSGSYRGESGGDQFTKREKANEDYYVKQHEQEALKKLRKEIESREKEVADLKKREEDLSK